MLPSQQDNLDEHQCEQVSKLKDAIATHSYERRHAAKIGAFIRSASIAPTGYSTSTGRYRWVLKLEPEIERECTLYKKIAVDLVFKSPQVQQNEYRGRKLLKQLFEAIEENYVDSSSSLRVLPEKWDLRVRSQESKVERYRIICDALSSFTDGEAIRLHKRLFSADYGSLSDMV